MPFGAALLAALAAAAAAETPATSPADFQHFVPVEKGLSAEWVASLRQRGAGEVFRGTQLDHVAMPVGGIGAGQLYLRGDGRLTCWRIFARTGPGEVAHGLAVLVEGGGQVAARTLDREGFPEAVFRGEYPVGVVRYRADDFPVAVRLEVFSPFIPLSPEDSTLPATVLAVTLTNVSGAPVRAGVAGWLQNAVCLHSARRVVARRRSRVVRAETGTIALHSVEPYQPPPGQQPRETIVLANFEGEDYGEWKTTGTAFGTKPVGGRGPTAGTFRGKGLVDTYIPAQDGPQGTLTSPSFELSRRFVNFLVSGGAWEGKTCVDLLVDGKVVRTATGRNTENLEPHTWDVADLAGKQAVIRIVDEFSGGWGHINADQIELSDVPAAVKVDHFGDYGTMALALAGEAAGGEDAR